MEDDWDLHAVVRGCVAAATSCTSSPPLTPPLITDLASNSTTPFFSPSYTDHFCTQFLSLPDHFEDLHELLINPLRHKPSPQPPQTQQLISLPSTTASIPFLTLDQQKQRPSNNTKHSHGGSLLTTPRSKKKKNQMKKVCQVAAESLSSDIWAWRKYGQKPIKGSPYPRGYYRCSSSKGCMARKQVERNRSDPNMFIVTYTAEHNHPAPTHRNSLAGSTRQKPSSPPAVVASEGNESQTKQSACSSSASMEEETMESKETEVEEDGEEEDGFVISDMVVSEDFFWGLQEPDGPGTIGDYFPDQYPADFGIPWVVNSSAATAASSS